MMARKLIPIGMASLMFLGPALARAGSERLSLKRAIEVALDKSPLLQAARHEVEAVEAGVGQARAGFLPKLDISESFTRADNPVFAFSSKLDEGRFTQADFEVDRLNRPGPENNFRTNLSLAQPIYTAGRASIGLQRARLSRDASARGFIRERQRVLFQVAKAYYGVLLAQENLEVIQSALRAAQANVELARLVSRPGLWSNLTSCPRRSAWRVSANRKSPQQIR
ncbi:MAG: TolC family protein [Candidatus Methylomirabilales bacterium]